MTTALVILAGALLAGFVSGLAGFGTALVSLGLWLHVIDPFLAAPLAIACSVIGHMLSLPSVRFAFHWRRLWPFLAGGLLGVPVGVVSLNYVEPNSFRLALGIFLTLYSAAMLLARNIPVFDRGGGPANGAVGLAGGILGGAAGLSGALPMIWCSLKGWDKAEQRAIYQPFNFTVLAWALVMQAQQGFVTAEVGKLVLICLPATIVGVRLGLRTYGRVDNRQFRQIILWLLLASGIVLTARSFL